MNFEFYEIASLSSNGYSTPVAAKHFCGGIFQVIKTGVTSDIKLFFQGSLDGVNFYDIPAEEIILEMTKSSEAYYYEGIHEKIRVGVDLLTDGNVRFLMKAKV